MQFDKVLDGSVGFCYYNRTDGLSQTNTSGVNVMWLLIFIAIVRNGWWENMKCACSNAGMLNSDEKWFYVTVYS